MGKVEMEEHKINSMVINLHQRLGFINQKQKLKHQLKQYAESLREDLIEEERKNKSPMISSKRSKTLTKKE